MKSSLEILKHRGYFEKNDLESFKQCSVDELICLLNSEISWERSIGAHLLKYHAKPEIAKILCQRLQKENKLYTKLAITDTLIAFKNIAIPILIPLLGKVGKNQYKKIPESGFRKKNYPLPRDIIARTIAHMGVDAIENVEEILLSGSRIQVLEAIDAVGYIAFYSQNLRSLPILWKVLENYPNDELILWKIIRALESFPIPEVITYLGNLSNQDFAAELKIEAQRSLLQIKRLKNKNSPPNTTLSF